MKILILPFVFKKFFRESNRVSGIDESMMRQFAALSTKHDVAIFLGYSDIEREKFFVFSKEEDAKELYPKQKQQLFKFLIETINKFDPDVILSNFGFSSSVYDVLNRSGKPIFCLSHSLPGTPADTFGAQKLVDFLSNGHSFGCVSDFHKEKTESFYSANKSCWVPGSIKVDVDSVVPSSYAVEFEIVPHDGKTVRNISACSQIKGTFIPHQMIDGDKKYQSEIFTTINYVGGDYAEEYFNKNMKQFENSSNCKTNLDIPHKEIMSRIADSVGFFVGLYNKDTFTITSIETLQKGIPLLIKGDDNIHPAHSFVGENFKQYVSTFKTKAEFHDIMNKYSQMTLEDRKALANSCLETMGMEKFIAKYESALNKCIEKYKNRTVSPLWMLE